MTKQELFTTAVTGLLAQQAYSFDPEADVCLYRGPNGTKCAIGWLIPDDRYEPTLEGAVAESLKVQQAAAIPPKLSRLAGQLQELHDNAARDDIPWPLFVSDLQEFAAHHELEMPA